jgi:uncharacterized protein (DUF305 family)
MRTIRTLVLVALATLAVQTLPVGGAPSRPTPTPAPHPTMARLTAVNGPSFDVAFMRELIPVHEEAVEIAYAATLNADHTELLRWNQVMIDRKTGEVKRMLAFLKEAGAAEGRRGAGVVTDPVKRMRTLRGAALEKAYIPLMAAHLEHSVALATLAASRATREEVRRLAANVARVEGAEVAMLRAWHRKWYGN